MPSDAPWSLRVRSCAPIRPIAVGGTLGGLPRLEYAEAGAGPHLTGTCQSWESFGGLPVFFCPPPCALESCSPQGVLALLEVHYGLVDWGFGRSYQSRTMIIQVLKHFSQMPFSLSAVAVARSSPDPLSASISHLLCIVVASNQSARLTDSVSFLADSTRRCIGVWLFDRLAAGLKDGI